VVQKDEAPELICKALRKVRDGELWLDRASTAKLFEELLGGAEGKLPEGRIANLTIRESDIVRALLQHEGASSRELAQSLGMSEQTLRNHFSSIYRKLGIPNRVGLVAYAARQRLGGNGG
jgi:DNA-binding NarL/FixJ family response regulator